MLTCTYYTNAAISREAYFDDLGSVQLDKIFLVLVLQWCLFLFYLCTSKVTELKLETLFSIFENNQAHAGLKFQKRLAHFELSIELVPSTIIVF